jgi:hypothetical protein
MVSGHGSGLAGCYWQIPTRRKVEETVAFVRASEDGLNKSGLLHSS